MRILSLGAGLVAATIALTGGVASSASADDGAVPSPPPNNQQARPEGVRAQPAKLTWPILPRTRLRGFPDSDGPTSIAVNGKGTRAYVLGPTQMVKLNITPKHPKVLGRSGRVFGDKIVANPKHGVAYVKGKNNQRLKVAIVWPKHAKVVRTIRYNCGYWCGMADIAMSHGGHFLLVGYFGPLHNRLDIYSLAHPKKPKRIARKRIGVEPDSIAVSPNGDTVVIEGLDDNLDIMYTVLDISKRRHPKIIKRRTGLPFNYTGPVAARYGNKHFYLTGQRGARVFVADYSVTKNRVTRTKRLMTMGGDLNGADTTHKGGWLYITDDNNKICVVGTKRLRKRFCHAGFDHPAGVAVSHAGKSHNRAYFPDGDYFTYKAWLNVLGRVHR